MLNLLEFIPKTFIYNIKIKIHTWVHKIKLVKQNFLKYCKTLLKTKSRQLEWLLSHNSKYVYVFGECSFGLVSLLNFCKRKRSFVFILLHHLVLEIILNMLSTLEKVIKGQYINFRACHERCIIHRLLINNLLTCE